MAAALASQGLRKVEFHWRSGESFTHCNMYYLSALSMLLAHFSLLKKALESLQPFLRMFIVVGSRNYSNCMYFMLSMWYIVCMQNIL